MQVRHFFAKLFCSTSIDEWHQPCYWDISFLPFFPLNDWHRGIKNDVQKQIGLFQKETNNSFATSITSYNHATRPTWVCQGTTEQHLATQQMETINADPSFCPLPGVTHSVGYGLDRTVSVTHGHKFWNYFPTTQMSQTYQKITKDNKIST